MMRTLNINWLGECEKCGCQDVIVQTERGNADLLYSGDKLKCAWSLWDEE